MGTNVTVEFAGGTLTVRFPLQSLPANYYVVGSQGGLGAGMGVWDTVQETFGEATTYPPIARVVGLPFAPELLWLPAGAGAGVAVFGLARLWVVRKGDKT